MKINTIKGIACATVLAASAHFGAAQTADLIINSFDTGIQGEQPSGCGYWYGSYTAGWDASEDATGNGGGSLYIQSTWGGSDTPLTEYICLPGNNLWWSGNGTYNLSEYQSIQFDIKWDPNSTITVDQWNDPSTFPNGSLAGSVTGLEIDAADGSGGTPAIMSTNIPALAASGWVRMTIPVNPAQSGIDPSVGIMLKKWLNNNGSITGTNEFGEYTNTANFWIDNVMLEGTAEPPPPPTVKSPQKAQAGLNVFTSTSGIYDRQEIMSLQTVGLSWLGNATQGNPVEYSFTIADFPTDPATYGCTAYLFLSPNPGYNPTAPDWNDTNCTIVGIQYGADGAIMRFQYKVDEDGGNAMYGGGTDGNRGISYTNAPGSWDGITTPYYESGDLGSVTNPIPMGTWTIRFTSDTNVTLIAPSGSTSSVVIPPYNVDKLGPTGDGFNLYLGFQANNNAALNHAVVYSSFSAQGVPSAFNEDFLAQSMLDTNAWTTSVSSGPNGVLIVPADSAYWLSWTLPDSGFSAQTSATVSNPNGWDALTGPVLSMVDQRAQLIMEDELSSESQAYFRLIKRQFTKLQILLPGETAAPGTPSGKTGTPDTQNTIDTFFVTVRAVDNEWYPVSGITDIVHFTSTDPSAFLAPDAGLVNGEGSFEMLFWTPGAQTITVEDLSDPTKTPDTSSPFTVN